MQRRRSINRLKPHGSVKWVVGLRIYVFIPMITKNRIFKFDLLNYQNQMLSNVSSKHAMYPVLAIFTSL